MLQPPYFCVALGGAPAPCLCRQGSGTCHRLTVQPVATCWPGPFSQPWVPRHSAAPPRCGAAQVLESICRAVVPGGCYIVGDMSTLDRWAGGWVMQVGG